MRRTLIKQINGVIATILLATIFAVGMCSCGTTRAHVGIDHDFGYDWGAGQYFDNSHHHKPPKHKHKKHKKPKHHKAKHKARRGHAHRYDD